MKKGLSAVIIVLVFVGFGALWQFANQESGVIANFEECAAAGNPVMESYPRQCRHNDQTFVEEVELNETKDVETGNIPTSADNAPPGSIHNLPVPDAVAAVRALVASELGISKGVVIVMSVYEREWPDGCLGLAGLDEFCIQVITPGYEVTVQAQGSLRTYRTNDSGSVIRREE